MIYEKLLGHTGLYDEGKKLHSMTEVADFIHTHDCGYIAEADGRVSNSSVFCVRHKLFTNSPFQNRSIPSPKGIEPANFQKNY